MPKYAVTHKLTRETMFPQFNGGSDRVEVMVGSKAQCEASAEELAAKFSDLRVVEV